MKSKTKVLLSLVCIVSLFLSFSLVALAKPGKSGKSAAHRFYGHDRFQTSTSIASALYDGQKVQNIVLASGHNFPDALSASTLAYQLKAPIILVSPGHKDSMVSYNFVKDHLVAGGTVTIVGGKAIISHSSEQWLLDNGFHVNRLGGKDRFDTNSLIVNQLNVPHGTPVIIASGTDFPDALGISSLAASKGWPILLSNPSNLPQSVQEFLISDQPTDIYIVGGEGIIQNGVYKQIQTLSPNSKIQRLGGYDRFETLALILNKFYPNPTQIYVANGFDFADALSGSTLAATHNAPILLVDPNSNNLPKSLNDYLVMLRNKNVHPQVNVLGGEGAVPQRLIDKINDVLENDGETTTPSETLTVRNPSITGFIVGVSPAINNMTINDFTLRNSSGTQITLTSATVLNGGAEYALTASLNAGQIYTLTAAKAGYTFGPARYVVVPTTIPSETLTVSNPSTTGFIVGVSPAINNMTLNDFSLRNSSGTPINLTSATALNGGAAYALTASLSAGQIYTLTATKTGYTFGPAQYVVVPTTTPSEALTVSEPSTTGFTLTVNPALNGLNASDFILMDGSSRVTISSVSTTNSGATYKISATLTAGHTYTVTAAKGGYYFGTAQNVVVPLAATVSSAAISDSRHIVLTMNKALIGLIGDPEAFEVVGVASNPTITNVTVSGTKVTLALSSSIVSTDAYVTVNYAKTGTRDLTNGAPVANFSILIVN